MRERVRVGPGVGRLLEELGARLKAARLRRRYAAAVVAQRAEITRSTLYRLEQGDPGVAMGSYARVLQVLRLEKDLNLVAVDDVLGRKLQDAGLGTRARAPRRKTVLLPGVPPPPEPEGRP